VQQGACDPINETVTITKPSSFISTRTSTGNTGSYCDQSFDVVYEQVAGRDLLLNVDWVDPSDDPNKCANSVIELATYALFYNPFTHKWSWKQLDARTCHGSMGSDAGYPEECQMGCGSYILDYNKTDLRVMVKASRPYVDAGYPTRFGRRCGGLLSKPS